MKTYIFGGKLIMSPSGFIHMIVIVVANSEKRATELVFDSFAFGRTDFKDVILIIGDLDGYPDSDIESSKLLKMGKVKYDHTLELIKSKLEKI